LRVPAGCRLRPVLTGWYAEFDALERSGPRERVAYGAGAAAFAGATYDPTAHYRAAAVFEFHLTRGLTPERLRAISRHQVGRLEQRVLEQGIDPAVAAPVPIPAERRAGFLAVQVPEAARLTALLRERGVRVDHHGTILRFGPAPYLSD